MNFRRFIHPALVRRLPLLVLLIACLVTFPESSTAQPIQMVVEDPQLYPAYSTCPQTYWYPFDNNRGHTAYLTLNTNNPAHSTNHGEWHPAIPQAGYYQVEAYIAGHSPITWCTGQGRTINNDTTDAHYSIYHAYGVSNRILSQYPLNNAWLNLGEYYFNAGSSGYVSLTDLNGEAEYSTTISFSAMRFTFTRLTRPQTYLPLIHHTDPSGRPPPDVGVVQAQGFDACHLPTISEMQTWWNQSPYTFFGLYIGGIHVPSFCSLADAAWVKAVHQQGWSFVPTWVGPQAPCSSYLHKMSSDPTISYQEGRQEADAASSAAAAKGLTNYGLGGTIIYYDLEPYGIPTPECRQPVSAFMNGWVERLIEQGNFSGGYGSSSSYPSDWSTIQNIPDDIWPASWYTNIYDPNATVFGISWLEGLWTNHQRIRQYAGEVNNTWGGVTLNIDINVADGMVAMPPIKPLASPIVTTSPSIQDTGWLSVAQGWLVLGNHLYWTNDRGKTWADISPTPVQLAYFLPAGKKLPSGQAWALSIPNQKQVTLCQSSTGGATWESLELPLPPANWWPLQLHFTSATTGWVVMQTETSQAFRTGILLKTRNDGITWQTYPLPTAGKITFTSETEGWLMNNTKDGLYHTTDGGKTWLPTKLDKYLLSQPMPPEGNAISGWQTNSLGWSATSQGSCNGDKSSLSFTCQVNTALWQTVDGGQNWENIPTPNLK
jgi:photosystem II stability/assembly factor-like uncharacterized protein